MRRIRAFCSSLPILLAASVEAQDRSGHVSGSDFEQHDRAEVRSFS